MQLNGNDGLTHSHSRTHPRTERELASLENFFWWVVDKLGKKRYAACSITVTAIKKTTKNPPKRVEI
jgi:predicted DNA-binding ribbon-helix-helix protein